MINTLLVCKDAMDSVGIDQFPLVYSMEKYRVASDTFTLDTFTDNRNDPAIKQALNMVERSKEVFDSKNPNSISCSNLTSKVSKVLNNDLKLRNNIKYIADKSVILSTKNMIALYNSYVFELQYNPKIQVTYLVDYYLHGWKSKILNTTPFITFEQYAYNLQGAAHYTIAEKASYLKYCIDTGQYLVNPRGDQNDVDLDYLLNRDRENFFSYMRILDRTHTP